MAAEEGSTQTPDLAAILATLAQYSAPGVATEPNTPEASRNATPVQGAISRNGAGGTPVPADKVNDPRLRPQGRSAAASPKPMIDPATITEWTEGLRCVTKIAAQNAQFAASIKRMMQDQRAHEMRWYTERQNLKQTQTNRTASEAKAKAILKSLNTSFYEEPPAVEKPEIDKAKELADFDRKIYSAQVAMDQTMTVELKALGVPFFGTDPTLVAPDGLDLSKEQPVEGRPKWSIRVTESQLLELTRKMVGHLEALYRE